MKTAKPLHKIPANLSAKAPPPRTPSSPPTVHESVDVDRALRGEDVKMNAAQKKIIEQIKQHLGERAQAVNAIKSLEAQVFAARAAKDAAQGSVDACVKMFHALGDKT